MIRYGALYWINAFRFELKVFNTIVFATIYRFRSFKIIVGIAVNKNDSLY